jgi:hypothetical protein
MLTITRNHRLLCGTLLLHFQNQIYSNKKVYNFNLTEEAIPCTFEDLPFFEGKEGGILTNTSEAVKNNKLSNVIA